MDGVKWVPELLDHNTAEWKKLAREVETELNEVYSSAKNLSKWYKKVRIDSFNKGSVLVDYFVELTDLSRDVSTLEIRKLFHEALVPVSEPTTTPTTPSAADNEDDYDGGERDDDGGEKLPAEKTQRENLQAPVPRVKEVFQLGKFKVDPVYTDFTGRYSRWSLSTHGVVALLTGSLDDFLACSHSEADRRSRTGG